jgi:predicted glutamine amidotransferase
MCGIVGYIGKHTIDAEKAFQDMLRVDVVRGADSTGVAFCNNNGASAIVKFPALPDDLFCTKPFSKAWSKSWDCYIGHNRFATQGDITVENAHPFRHGHIIGVHNGTLRGKFRLDDANKFEVDSEALIYNIAKNGIEKTWNMTDGAAAVVYWNSKDKSLNFIRNSERPLLFARNEDASGIYFASEAWMIGACLHRNSIKHQAIYITEPDKLYTLKLSKEEVNITYKKLDPFSFRTQTNFGSGRPNTTNRTGYYPGRAAWEDDLDKREKNLQASDEPVLDLVEPPKSIIPPTGSEPTGHVRHYNPVTCTVDPPPADKQDSNIRPFVQPPKEGGQVNGSGTPANSDTPVTQTSDSKKNTPSTRPVLDNKTISIIHNKGVVRKESGDKSRKNFPLFPKSAREVYDKDGKTIKFYRIECGVQNDRSKTVFIAVDRDDQHGLLDYVPGFGRHYSKAFFLAPILEVAHGATTVDFIAKASDVEIKLPSDCVRTCHHGEKLNRAQFDKKYKECVWCTGDLDFEDINILFGIDDKAACGECHIRHMKGEGGSFTLDDLRQYLGAA